MNWLVDLIETRDCPGLIVGLSGTDSILTFVADFLMNKIFDQQPIKDFMLAKCGAKDQPVPSYIALSQTPWFPKQWDHKQFERVQGYKRVLLSSETCDFPA